ncbi:MAG: chorismate mutase [Agathobacter sp.]|nr:chorismate mutase [Agathobacter sp.]
MRDLARLRTEIDEIDRQMVKLYADRMQLAAEVAEYKISVGKPVLDRERERTKLNALEELADSDFMRHGIRELFEQIMSMSRKKQYQLLTEHGMAAEQEFTGVDGVKRAGVRVVFQGVEGAYSQQAMRTFFGEGCDGLSVETWKDAMEAIADKRADYAVLPIQNSSAGIVPENYDLLVQYDNYIVGEQILKIDHALLALPEAKPDDIACIFSHPQALMQCSAYLDGRREVEKISVKNTAEAAKKVREDADPRQAAIASALTAEIYGLKVLEHAIQNNKNNSTRFIIVSGEKQYQRNAENISICIEIPHESGSLYRVLSHFIYNGLNMTNIQSRPIPERNWEYRFFIDFEGRLTDHAVTNALRGLAEEANFLKILGTY